MTTKQWRTQNPELAEKGNIRDFTDLLHLVIITGDGACYLYAIYDSVIPK